MRKFENAVDSKQTNSGDFYLILLLFASSPGMIAVINLKI